MRLKKTHLQSAGIFLSFLCAIHCLLLPFVIVAASFIGLGFLNNPLFEILLLPFAFLIGGYTLYQDYQHHQKSYPFLLLFTSLLIFIPALIIHNHALIAIGAVVLVTAQFLNWRLHKQHVCV